MNNLLSYIDEKFSNNEFLLKKYQDNSFTLSEKFKNKTCLVLGAGGSIGQEVCLLLIKLKIKKLIIVDIDENRLTLVIRRINQIIDKSIITQSYLVDCSDKIFHDKIFKNEILNLDHVFNFTAIKHVRTERDITSISVMLKTNCLLPYLVAKKCAKNNIPFFHVSTDKANDPVNLMAATKLIGEKLAFNEFIKNKNTHLYKSARFPNVLFSNGSLTMSFIERILNNEIISIPKNIKRYFISRVQSAMICLLSFIDNQSNIITLNEKYLKEISFDKICYSILKKIKIKPLLFHDISKIDNFRIDRNKKIKLWPIYIFKNIQKNEKKLEKLKIELKSKEYLLTIKDKLFISYKINISNYINFDKKIKRFKNIINSKKTSNLHYEDIITLINSTLNIRLKKLKTKDHLDKII